MNHNPPERDLEKFLGGPNKPAQYRLRVTLRGKPGILSFNKRTYQELGKSPAVYLYFSRVRDLIAIEPVQSINMPGAFPVLEKNISGYRINAAPFCRHYGIRIDTTVRFPHAEIRNGRLELKLAETICVAQAPRPKKKKG